jgi:hypothetical protein
MGQLHDRHLVNPGAGKASAARNASHSGCAARPCNARSYGAGPSGYAAEKAHLPGGTGPLPGPEDDNRPFANIVAVPLADFASAGMPGLGSIQTACHG